MLDENKRMKDLPAQSLSAAQVQELIVQMLRVRFKSKIEVAKFFGIRHAALYLYETQGLPKNMNYILRDFWLRQARLYDIIPDEESE